MAKDMEDLESTLAEVVLKVNKGTKEVTDTKGAGNRTPKSGQGTNRS